MNRMTYLVYCFYVAVSVCLAWQDACAADRQTVRPISKLSVSTETNERVNPSNPDDDSLLRKMLPVRGHKYLKLGSDLEGLADRGVSQPCREAS